MKEMYHQNFESLNLRGISPSLPGCGYTDVKFPGFRVANWPKDDLEPILAAEGVEQFMCFGASMGTPAAQAVGFHFGPERCTALGIVVPQVGKELWGETTRSGKKVPEVAGFSRAPGDKGLQGCNAGLWYGLNEVFMPMIQTEKNFKGAVPGLKKMADEFPQWYSMLVRGGLYNFARGTYGTTCILMGSQWGEFGFHPRDIKTKKLFLLYAEDDHQQLPVHGEILADVFREKEKNEGIDLIVEAQNEGWDHFTGYTPKHIAERSVAKVLLEM